MNNFLLGLMSMGIIGRRFYEADGGSGGGGAGGSGDGKGGDGKGGDGKGGDGKGGAGGGKSDADVIAELRAENEKLKNPGKGKDDQTLNDRIDAERKEKEKSESNNKALERAMKFTIKSQEFLKENESILPKTANEIFAAADKEKYGTAIEKESAIKAAMIQDFFSLQANVDLLTPAHKTKVEDYLKLTKNGREERSQQVYEDVFEPALEILKRAKRADELQRAKNGYGNSSDTDEAYKKKMMGFSRKHYFGEKGE